jgi:NADH-quinone oxidoreductase subunit E
MLSDIERSKIEAEIARFPSARAALSEALMIVQEGRGWVSDEALGDVARALGLPPASVEAVATFYELVFRRPVGRHVILVCDSVSCWLRGEESIMGHLRSRLGIEPGQTTEDGLFTLLPAGCLGLCEQAPAMMVDGQPYGNLSPEKADAILAKLEEGSNG